MEHFVLAQWVAGTRHFSHFLLFELKLIEHFMIALELILWIILVGSLNDEELWIEVVCCIKTLLSPIWRRDVVHKVKELLQTTSLITLLDCLSVSMVFWLVLAGNSTS